MELIVSRKFQRVAATDLPVARPRSLGPTLTGSRSRHSSRLGYHCAFAGETCAYSMSIDLMKLDRE